MTPKKDDKEHNIERKLLYVNNEKYAADAYRVLS